MSETAASDRIGSAVDYTFVDDGLLTEALTHSSFVAENDGAVSYERLEFLGDAVLELITTRMIFDAMPGMPEGAMTKIRASVVDEPTLARVADRWHLGAGLRLGRGEERAGGRARASILSDAVEAVVAAIYLDGGIEAAGTVVRSAWAPLLHDRLSQDSVSDPRSALQELLAKRSAMLEFAYQRSGPDHAVVFTATALVDGAEAGSGQGGSKKAAAIAAAQDALDRGV
ncbi:MAG: ribonuclease III [Acidimicrobiia bacterium]